MSKTSSSSSPFVLFKLVSSNAKTGPIPVSTSSSATCPDSCPMKQTNSCYAKFGPIAIFWRKLSEGNFTNLPSAMNWEKFCETISDLPDNQIWRMNQAGDLPGENEKIDVNLLTQLVLANNNKRGFTYTHKNVLGKSKIAKDNREAIKWANDAGFTINLSADNLQNADEKMALNIGPVVVILPKGTANKFTETPAGNVVFTCPATMPGNDDKKVNCLTCGLCAKGRAERKNIIIGFPAHGIAINRADKVARGE